MPWGGWRDSEQSNELRVLRLLGETAAHADPPDVEQVENSYRQVQVLGEELGMRPLVAQCQLGLGSPYQRVGRTEQAHAELATAPQPYRRIEMRFWLARAQTTLAQLAN